MKDGLTFRRPTDADHPAVVTLVDEWWGGRKLHDYLPRLWFEHFSGTSWLVEDAAGLPAGFLVGFVSPDHPDTAYIHMVAVSPNHRRSGLGAALYDRFTTDVRARGVRYVHAITWPGNRTSIGFHQARGFRATDGPGFEPVYGIPAHIDHDYPGEDRVVFVLDLDELSAGG